MKDNANPGQPYELPMIPPTEKAPPATRLERENAVNEALKDGNFRGRIEEAMKRGDHNLADVLNHAHASRDFESLSGQAGELQGKIAAAEARLKFVKPEQRDAEREQIAGLKKELSSLQPKIKQAAKVAQSSPVVALRSAADDRSDAATFTALAAVQDGPFVKYAPIINERPRGLRATIDLLEERGIDPDVPVVLLSSQGWRYQLVRNEFGQTSVELIGQNGRTLKLRDVEGDERPPVLDGGEIHQTAEQYYGRPLPRADLRTSSEKEDDAFGLKASVGRPDAVGMLRRALTKEGYRLVRKRT